jgi:hypothetical protein
MKKYVAIAAGLMVFGLSSQVTANESVSKVQYDGLAFAGDVNSYKFCKAVLTDDVMMLKRALNVKADRIAPNANRRAVLKEVTTERGVLCNEQNLVEFARNQGASNVYEYINRKS